MSPPGNSGTFYFGVLMALSNADWAIRLTDVGSSTHSGGVLIGQYNGNAGGLPSLNWYLTVRPFDTGYSRQVTADTGIPGTTATTYLVGKIDFNTNGALDTVRLFVNPANANELGSQACAWRTSSPSSASKRSRTSTTLKTKPRGSSKRLGRCSSGERAGRRDLPALSSRPTPATQHLMPLFLFALGGLLGA